MGNPDPYTSWRDERNAALQMFTEDVDTFNLYLPLTLLQGRMKPLDFMVYLVYLYVPPIGTDALDPSRRTVYGGWIVSETPCLLQIQMGVS